MEEDTSLEREYPEREHRQTRPPRSKTPFIIMAALIVATVVIFLITYIKKNRTYTSWTEVGAPVSMEALSTRGGLVSYENGFIRYSCDGAEAIGADGRVLWNISYNQTYPIARSCGKCAVFADFGGRTFNITDGTGSNTTIEVSEDIVDAAVSEQGIAAVLTDGITSDHIRVYSLSGDLLVEMETKAISDGFPIAMAISPDGRKLVTSYLQIGDTQETWVTFYNFGNVGQNYADKIVGSYSFGTHMVPDIRFVGNERVAAFYDTGFVLYKIKETPSEMVKADLNTPIGAVFAADDYFGISASLTSGGNEVTLYDINGKEKKRLTTGLDFTGISAADDELILYCSSSCIIYRMDGTEKFRTALRERIAGIYPVGGDRYLAVGADYYKQMRLVTAKEDENTSGKIGE